MQAEPTWEPIPGPCSFEVAHSGTMPRITGVFLKSRGQPELGTLQGNPNLTKLKRTVKRRGAATGTAAATAET
ncbi:unnamed protein product [Arctogadus glacialis]